MLMTALLARSISSLGRKLPAACGHSDPMLPVNLLPVWDDTVCLLDRKEQERRGLPGGSEPAEKAVLGATRPVSRWQCVCLSPRLLAAQKQQDTPDPGREARGRNDGSVALSSAGRAVGKPPAALGTQQASGGQAGRMWEQMPGCGSRALSG